MQVVFVYWFTVLYKTGPEWRADGTAVYYALNVDKMVTPIGQYLLQFPSLLKPLTHAVFWYEVIGPLLLFSPVFTGPIRTLTIVGFALLHLGIGSSMKIGIFPYIGTLSMLGFLPPWFWEKTVDAAKTKDRLGLRIYYDQDCGFCARSVRLIKAFFLLPKVELFPWTIDPSIERDMTLHNSWVLLDAKENRYFGFRGVVAALESSPLFWPLALMLRLGWMAAIGERLYSWVAIHRRVTCALPMSSRETALKLSPIANFFVLFLLVYVFFWNLATLPNTGIKFSERARSIGYVLRLDQTWNMFAPYPLKDDGWYVIPGRLKDGEVVDLNNDGARVTLDRPLSISQTYKNYRWRKYLDNLLSESIRSYRVYYAEYLCRAWNVRHNGSEILEELDIIYMLEWTLPNYQHPVPRPVRLLRHRCEASAK